MEQKPERIRTLGCGGLIRLAMELDKNDYEHEPKVVLDATDGKKDAKHAESHVRVSLAESTCRKLAAILTQFADKLAASRGGHPAKAEEVATVEVEVEPAKTEETTGSDK